jgi:hypothetical protein
MGKGENSWNWWKFCKVEISRKIEKWKFMEKLKNLLNNEKFLSSNKLKLSFLLNKSNIYYIEKLVYYKISLKSDIHAQKGL